MSEDPIARLREMCLALPEATEGAGVGNPTFRVREKIFTMQHPHEGRMSIWLKAPPGVQQMLVTADPRRFFVPPYVGQHGWIADLLSALDPELREQVRRREEQLTVPSDELSGDLRVTARWDGSEHDLDLVILPPQGYRVSWLGAPTRAVISATDVIGFDIE